MANLLSRLSYLSYQDFWMELKKVRVTPPSPIQFMSRQFHLDKPALTAAVLVPFIKIEDEWRLVFIHRVENHHLHSGQVAFPGGKHEEHDPTMEFTALREAKEEIGIEPEEVLVARQVTPLLTVTNFLITPILGLIPYPYSFKPNPSEVSRLFSIPITWLADQQNYKIIPRQFPEPIGVVHTIYYEPYDQEILWGASAQIVYDLIDLLKQETP